MFGVFTRWAAILLLAFATLGARTAGAQQTSLAADATRAGVIDLIYAGAPGARVAFFEHVGDMFEPQGTGTIPANGRLRIVEATTWRCDRVVRRFFAVAVAPGGSVSTGTFDVRTGSCKHRFTVAAPRRVAIGAKARVRVIDRWGIGGAMPRLCIDPPRAKRTCRTLRFAKAVTIRSRGFRATTAGRWRIDLRAERSSIRTSVTVGRGGTSGPATPPTLLATGDSTMQSIDSFLADRLADKADVRSDVLPGSGISQTSTFWLHRAASQARHLRPRTTVVSIGANDFFPMRTPTGTTVPCCDKPWDAEYARRVRAMMRSYIQRGHGRVLWLALPLGRDPRRAVVNVQVNAAIRRAAAGLDHAFVIGLDDLFTPHGFAKTIRWHGQVVHVREPDGIHLNVQGTSIVAELIETTLDKLDAASAG